MNINHVPTLFLFNNHGQRLYVTLAAASKADRHIRTLCLVMAYTGCQISEALALTGNSLDWGQRAIVFRNPQEAKRWGVSGGAGAGSFTGYGEY